MRILITGPDGFVGRAVCAEFQKNGVQVRGALWEPVSEPLNFEPVVVGGIDKNTNWKNALENIDVVVHLAARVHVMQDNVVDPLNEYRKVNVDGTSRLAAEAVEAGVKRFIFISSVKVHGEATDGTPYCEESETLPQDDYGISKLEAEKALQEITANSDIKTVVLRPPLIYGPSVKANFLKLLNLVYKGVPLPLGKINNCRSLLGLTNFASVIRKCAESSELDKHNSFLVSDNEDVSTPDLIKKIASAFDKKPRLLNVPVGLLKLAGRLSAKEQQISRLCSSLQVDSAKIRKQLNWTPPLDMASELKNVAQWYLSR